MGKLAVYKYVAMMFLVLQLIVSAYTFLGLFGGDVNPAGNMARAMVVYILPILIIANFLLLIYWLVRKRWVGTATFCQRETCGTRGISGGNL